eukprot:scaffold65029_cov49-Phaeocystis_antarctica.AAC.1
MAQIKRWRPCPMASRSNAYKQRFWCHDRPRSEKNGGFGYARGIFHEETMSEQEIYLLGSRDYANKGYGLKCPGWWECSLAAISQTTTHMHGHHAATMGLAG